MAARAGGRRDRVVASLEALVEHSLVVAEPTGRLRLLEPVAQYARDLLRRGGRVGRGRRGPTPPTTSPVAEANHSSYRDGGQVAALTRIDLEHANLTAAAERSLALGDVETPARMAWELWLYWWLRGHHDHGRRFAENALQRSEALPDEVHARAALAAATMAFAMDDVDGGRSVVGARPRARRGRPGDPRQRRGRRGPGRAGGRRPAPLPVTASRRPCAMPRSGGAEVEWTWGLAHVWLGTVALLGGDADEAVRLIEAGLDSARRRDDRLSSYIALYNLFQVELGRGDHTAARRHLEEGTRLSLETGDQANLAYLLDAGAVLAAATGQHARVPLLLGAAQAIREALGSHGYGYYRPDPATIEAAAADARTHLGADRYDDALDTGRGLSATEAAAMLRDASPRDLTTPAHHPYTSGCPWCAGRRAARSGAAARTRARHHPRSRHEHRRRHVRHPHHQHRPRRTRSPGPPGPGLGPRRHRRGSPRCRRWHRQRHGGRRLRPGPRRGPGRHHRPAVRRRCRRSWCSTPRR